MEDGKINKVKGTPGRPKPGKKDMRVPVRIREADITGIALPEEAGMRARRAYFKKTDFGG